MEVASFEQQHIGVNARFMSAVCQKLTGPAFKNGTTLVFINQIREKIGGYSPGGILETTPGGRALKFYSTIRMSVRRGDTIKQDGEQVGHVMRIRVIKNKIASPFKEATINLIYGQGIDRSDELFQIALKAKLIKQGGAWYSYVNEDGEIKEFNGVPMKSQGKDGMIDFIRTIPEFYVELESIIRGVKVEADDIPEEEVLAMKEAATKDEENKSAAAKRAYEKNKKALEEKKK